LPFPPISNTQFQHPAVFKQIHCITFGSPPVALLPLAKPPNPRHAKALFLTLINEGDPVPRADKAYIRSLLDLYASPAPTPLLPASAPPAAHKPCALLARLRPGRNGRRDGPGQTAALEEKGDGGGNGSGPVWPVPLGTLSVAGRAVVLREGPEHGPGAVRAVVTTDEGLRAVVFGNPVMHMMSVYVLRVEALAVRAVTGRGEA
jgi:hypothetical protein